MRRLTVVLLTATVLAIVAGSAAPAGAAVITPNVEKVFTRVLAGDATGVAATAKGGSAYVCGTRMYINHGTDVTIDRVGSNRWSKYWNGPASKDDAANDVAVSPKGQVYVVGRTQKADGDNRLLVLKYSAAGKRLWTRTWSGPAGSTPMGVRVAVDGKGRVVVVGQCKVKGATHVFVAQYSSAGKRLWVRISSAGYMGLVRDIYVDSSNNVYVAGQCQATEESTYRDALLLKYSATGVPRWRETYDSLYGQSDSYFAVCRRPGGGVYVAGGSSQSGSDFDGIVMRYTATGKRADVARIGENDGAYTSLYDAVVTSDGRLVVGGDTSAGSGTADEVIYSYTDAGVQTWAKTLDSDIPMMDIFRSERCEFLVAYGDGRVAATGYWARHKSGEVYPQVVMTHFLDADGDVVDTSVWDGPVTGETEAHDMVVKSGHVWIAGQCFGDAPYAADGFALRYDR